MLRHLLKPLIVLSTIILFIITVSIIACERTDIFEVSKNLVDSRTAYAITHSTDGVNDVYYLIIANNDFDARYMVTPPFENYDIGLSVNEKDIIAYQFNYTYKASNDLKYWIVYSDANSPVYNTKVFPQNGMFIYFNNNSYYQIFKFDNTWNPYGSANSYILGCFLGHDKQAYCVEAISGTGFGIYNPDDLVFQIAQYYYTLTVPSTLVFAYKTSTAYYIIGDLTSNSIFKLYNSNSYNLNSSPLGAGTISSATVTDDDKIFVVHYENNLLTLKQIISDGNYISILTIGNDTDAIYKVTIDAIDNNTLIIATAGLEDGYNGLFIFDIKSLKISKYITTEDTVALYVPR